MRHKTPAVVQHGSKTTPLDQGPIYDSTAMVRSLTTAFPLHIFAVRGLRRPGYAIAFKLAQNAGPGWVCCATL